MYCLIAVCLCLSSEIDNAAVSNVTLSEISVSLEDPILIETLAGASIDECVSSNLIAPITNKSSFGIVLTPEEQKDVTYIISELGAASRMKFMQSYAYLADKHASLDEAGQRIANISIMQFLAFIFSQSNLKDDMKAICDFDGIPWKKMRKNTIKGLRACYSRGEMMPQLEGFCSYIGAHYQNMKELAEKEDWRSFLYALL